MRAIIMGKVYVVQENPRMDYSPAEAYGDVVFMTADEYRPVAGSIRNQDIISDVQRHMATFDPAEDWLIMTGNPIMMGYAFHLAIARGSGVKCLQWDRISHGYREVKFDHGREQR